MRFPTRRIFTGTLLAAFTCLVTFALQAQSNPGRAGDGTKESAGADNTSAFIKQAARNNDMGIALAEVGARQAQNPQLKQYCLQLQQELTQANNQLKPIARQHGVSIDQSLTRKDLKELSALEQSKGANFDQKFATDVLKRQQQELTKLEEAATQVSAGDVRQYSEQTLPKLRQQFQSAQTVAQRVGVDQKTIANIVQPSNKAMGGSEGE